jgi:hypothetical protein
MCNRVHVVELELVDLIRKDYMPIIQSTINSNGHVTVRVEKMAKGVNYIAISHVWTGGLGNFKEN